MEKRYHHTVINCTIVLCDLIVDNMFDKYTAHPLVYEYDASGFS